jgi:hypothetical protein
MSEFKLGDLVEFIPENFDYPNWTFRLIGIGYIEKIRETGNIKGGNKVFHVYCGKVTKQQMKNFVEIEIKDKTFQIDETKMGVLCRKINSK